MKRRLVILTEIISPYRIPLFNALARSEIVDLHVIFLAETDPSLRQWQVYKDEIKFSHRILPAWRKRMGRYNVLLNRGVGQALDDASADVILCGGYSYVASWQSLLWARRRHIAFLLWSESNHQDLRRGLALVECLKKTFLERCDGFVVPGQSAREYLRMHKIRDELIFTAPNAVDNEFFAAQAERTRCDGANQRHRLGLPERYFFFVGRLVREKGVFELLSAYAKLDQHLRSQIGLVFVGDGKERAALERQASSIRADAIIFAGFAHREHLAQYYALAEALILPTYTDTWGLVVNEAMACGLPVILSRAAGCAADLVAADHLKGTCNGLLVPPKDVEALALAMTTMASQPVLRRKMADNSAQRISQYSPEEWANGIVRAVETLGAQN